MQRICSKLRSLSLLRSHYNQTTSTRFFHSAIMPRTCSIIRSPTPSSFVFPSSPKFSPLLSSFVQTRDFAVKNRKKDWKHGKKLTPTVSKIKKIKIKPYSSYKGRFRLLNDGTIRRWHEGKRHNAHLKSKRSKRSLRQPALVPAAYAKTMKKLNFHS